MDLICITGARFNQSATVLRQKREGDSEKQAIRLVQDEYTGEIIKEWYSETDDPDTESLDGNLIIPCMTEAIMDNGIRTNSASEKISKGEYRAYEYITMTFPADIIVTKRDQVTNITDSNGKVIWLEEEYESRPTVFNVNGVKPVTDPFGDHIENVAMLSRSDIQRD